MQSLLPLGLEQEKEHFSFHETLEQLVVLYEQILDRYMEGEELLQLHKGMKQDCLAQVT